MIKANNVAGGSSYTESLIVTVGQVPNAPSSLALVQSLSATSFEVAWTADVYITNNVQTLSYRIYIDDNSGNGQSLYYDTANYAISTQATLSGFTFGNSY